ncbi:MAG: PqqD family protein [Deltaproteobacteria bacterium]|nr:PqqD family protein [Deltaproteobacteria bacterium]
MAKPVKKSPEVLSRKTQDQALHVLHLSQYDVYYSIEGVALELWTMIDGKKTPDNLVKTLQRKHPAHAAKVPAKVKTWLTQFKKHGLIS